MHAAGVEVEVEEVEVEEVEMLEVVVVLRWWWC